MSDDEEREVPARVINGKLCVSAGALCDLFGVTRQSLGNWAKGGCPKEGRGWYSLKDVLAWKGIIAGKTGSGEPSVQQRKLEKEAERSEQQAENWRIRNEKARGELVSRADLIGALSPVFAELKRFLMGRGRDLAIRIAPYVDPITARKLGREIDEEMKGALRIIATGFEDVAPASTAKRKAGRPAHS